jgi:hypothetical protein
MDGWMNGQMDGLMGDGWVDGWIDGLLDELCFQYNNAFNAINVVNAKLRPFRPSLLC